MGHTPENNSSNAEPKVEAKWEHENGRNEPHWNKTQHPTLAKDLAEAKARLAYIKNHPYPHCAKDKLRVQKHISHLQLKLSQRGEEHCRKAKGFNCPMRTAR